MSTAMKNDSVRYNEGLKKKTKPHKCPVCGGTGIVPRGFYSMPTPGVVETSSTNISPETCRTCSGAGVLWG